MEGLRAHFPPKRVLLLLGRWRLNFLGLLNEEVAQSRLVGFILTFFELRNSVFDFVLSEPLLVNQEFFQGLLIALCKLDHFLDLLPVFHNVRVHEELSCLVKMPIIRNNDLTTRNRPILVSPPIVFLVEVLQNSLDAPVFH